jgi:hypothetical protein
MEGRVDINAAPRIAGRCYPRPSHRSYRWPIPDLTTQGAGKSWLSAIGSGGHDWARDISESVPCLLPAICVRRLSPGRG